MTAWTLDDRSYYAGVLAALQEVNAAMEDTLYDDIVEAIGPRALYREAERNGMDIKHLRRRWTSRGTKRKRREKR